MLKTSNISFVKETFYKKCRCFLFLQDFEDEGLEERLETTTTSGTFPFTNCRHCSLNTTLFVRAFKK
jgi:hypothetical protein